MTQNKVLLIVAAVLIAAALGWWSQKEAEPVPKPIVIVPEAVVEPEIKTITELEPAMEEPRQELELEPEIIIVDPPAGLSGSDFDVSAATIDLADGLQQWLVADEQIRKWVLALDNLADGNLVNKHQPWSFPLGAYVVKGDETIEELSVDPANYVRADPLLDVVLAIDPQKLAAYYRSWSPLLDQAYGELGRGGSFDQRLRSLIARVLAVQPLEEHPLLEHKSVMFTYKDPALELASDLEKALWRMGPENTRRIQLWVSEVHAAL
ncbi:MAG: DUF3014 domain-containing protein [Pseudomonadales bacterium]